MLNQDSVIWTQPLSPLCLWQCFINRLCPGRKLVKTNQKMIFTIREMLLTKRLAQKRIQTKCLSKDGEYCQTMLCYVKEKKTQCQLCKRLAGPFIPLSWSGKGFHLWLWSSLVVVTRGQSIAIFLCISLFSAWWQTTNQPNYQLFGPRVGLLLISEKEVFCNKMRMTKA